LAGKSPASLPGLRHDRRVRHLLLRPGRPVGVCPDTNVLTAVHVACGRPRHAIRRCTLRRHRPTKTRLRPLGPLSAGHDALSALAAIRRVPPNGSHVRRAHAKDGYDHASSSPTRRATRAGAGDSVTVACIRHQCRSRGHASGSAVRPRLRTRVHHPRNPHSAVSWGSTSGGAHPSVATLPNNQAR